MTKKKETRSLGDVFHESIPHLILTLGTTLVIISGAFYGLKSQTDINTKAIAEAATKEQIKQMDDWQQKYNDRVVTKLGKLDEKIDKIYGILLQEKK